MVSVGRDASDIPEEHLADVLRGDGQWGKVYAIPQGAVTRWDGRPLRVDAVIRRVWGWPKKAARVAAQIFRRDPSMKIAIGTQSRLRQQKKMLADDHSLLDLLLLGLAGRAYREVENGDREFAVVTLEFTPAVVNEGLVSALVQTVGHELGWTEGEARRRCQVTVGGTDGGEVARILVDLDGEDEKS